MTGKDFSDYKKSEHPPTRCILFPDGTSIMPRWEKDQDGNWRIPEELQKWAGEYMKKFSDSSGGNASEN